MSSLEELSEMALAAGMKSRLFIAIRDCKNCLLLLIDQLKLIVQVSEELIKNQWLASFLPSVHLTPHNSSVGGKLILNLSLNQLFDDFGDQTRISTTETTTIVSFDENDVFLIDFSLFSL